MQAVLQTAVDAGADSSKFPDTWLFHQKWGNGKKGPAPRLEGNKIEYIQVGGRVSFIPISPASLSASYQRPISILLRAQLLRRCFSAQTVKTSGAVCCDRPLHSSQRCKSCEDRQSQGAARKLRVQSPRKRRKRARRLQLLPRRQSEGGLQLPSHRALLVCSATSAEGCCI